MSATIALRSVAMVCKTAATCQANADPRLALAFMVLGLASPARARADPLRFRADAVAEQQYPAGLVVLQGQDKLRPWMEVEGVVWSGSRAGNETASDVVVLSLRLREPHGAANQHVLRMPRV